MNNKIPVQYLAKYTYVKGEKILFQEKVLLSGPEIDKMIDFSMKYISPGLQILDLCTGSGVIAVILTKFFPDTEFYASDISDDAIKNSEKNIEFHKLPNVKVLQGDLFELIGKNNIKDLDVIIANPPFCRTANIDKLSNQVKNNAPLIAIDGGEDGLYFFKVILSQAGAYLKKNGIIILQYEIGQLKEVEELLLQNSFEKIEIGYGQSGNEKYIAARYI